MSVRAPRLLPFLVSLLVACHGARRAEDDAGTDASSADATLDASNASDASDDVDGSNAEDAGPTDAGVDALVDADTDPAIPLVLNDPATTGTIDGPLRFRFDADEGEWITLWIGGLAEGLAFTLIDPSGETIRTGPPTPTGLLPAAMRLPATGRYYVVLERTASAPSPTSYAISVARVAFDGAPWVQDVEAGDTPADAVPTGLDVSDSRALALVAGTFTGASDVDLFAFSISDDEPFATILFDVAAGGTTGNGATVDVAPLEVLDATGTTVIAVAAPIPDVGTLFLLPTGDYLLRVTPAGAVGERPYYGITVQEGAAVLVVDPFEREDATNGTIATAEPFVGGGNLVGSLGAGDVDAFRFDRPEGEEVRITCTTALFGNGVMGFHADVFAATDVTASSPLASADELPWPTGATASFTTPSTASYVLRVTKSAQSPVLAGDTYLCIVQ